MIHDSIHLEPLPKIVDFFRGDGELIDLAILTASFISRTKSGTFLVSALPS